MYLVQKIPHENNHKTFNNSNFEYNLQSFDSNYVQLVRVIWFTKSMSMYPSGEEKCLRAICTDPLQIVNISCNYPVLIKVNSYKCRVQLKSHVNVRDLKIEEK